MFNIFFFFSFFFLYLSSTTVFLEKHENEMGLLKFKFGMLRVNLGTYISRLLE